MSDVFTKRKRSEVMSRIRGRGNKETELALAKLLRVAGVTGWRRQITLRIVDCGMRSAGPKATARRARRSRPPRHGGQANVRPDFIFSKQRVAVFVDGCFWHGCRWHCNQPQQNAAFWRRKLDANKRRDRLVNQTLRRAGWIVVRVWEHELGTAKGRRVVGRIRAALRRKRHG